LSTTFPQLFKHSTEENFAADFSAPESGPGFAFSDQIERIAFLTKSFLRGKFN
jgi:hypothetical protein